VRVLLRRKKKVCDEVAEKCDLEEGLDALHVDARKAREYVKAEE
jgi:hypothetical protein